MIIRLGETVLFSLRSTGQLRLGVVEEIDPRKQTVLLRLPNQTLVETSMQNIVPNEYLQEDE